jgi:hypothetical protein
MMSFWQAPVVVVALLTWLSSTPTSFADAAQREALRRQLMPKPTRQLSNLNLPASAIVTEASMAAAAAAAFPVASSDDAPTPPPAAAKLDQAQAAPAAPGAPAGDSHDEQWWRNRIASVRQDLDSHQRLAAALQSQINGLTADFTSRDDPAQRAKIAEDRRKAMDDLAGMQKQIDLDQKAVAAVQEDARRAGVPAGWVR